MSADALGRSPQTPPPHPDISDLIRTLSVLVELYTEPAPLKVDIDSYRAGFRAGAKSAYSDALTRLREMAGTE